MSSFQSILLLVSFHLFGSARSNAQIHYSHQFTKKLERAELNFIAPIEGMYRIQLLKKDDFLKYDLVLSSDDFQLDMRYILEPRASLVTPSHISFLSRTSSLAINDERFDISVHVFPSEEAISYFHADWAAFSDFIPKRSLTDKNYGRLISIYRVDRGLASTLILFNEHSEEKDRRMYSLTFSE